MFLANAPEKPISSRQRVIYETMPVYGYPVIGGDRFIQLLFVDKNAAKRILRFGYRQIGAGTEGKT
jgi:hypothetical protein